MEKMKNCNSVVPSMKTENDKKLQQVVNHIKIYGGLNSNQVRELLSKLELNVKTFSNRIHKNNAFGIFYDKTKRLYYYDDTYNMHLIRKHRTPVQHVNLMIERIIHKLELCGGRMERSKMLKYLNLINFNMSTFSNRVAADAAGGICYDSNAKEFFLLGAAEEINDSNIYHKNINKIKITSPKKELGKSHIIDELVLKVLEEIRKNKSKKASKRMVENLCKKIGLNIITLYYRISKNNAFGLSYDKKSKIYYIKEDVSVIMEEPTLKLEFIDKQKNIIKQEEKSFIKKIFSIFTRKK